MDSVFFIQCELLVASVAVKSASRYKKTKSSLLMGLFSQIAFPRGDCRHDVST